MGHFLPFYPSKSPKNQNFKNTKKKPGDIIILHKCTKNKNHDHLLKCSWDMVRDRYNCYFSFWAIFYPFNPLRSQKIKILKKWKKPLEILSFFICEPKILIRWCMVPEIWCTTDGQSDRWTGRWKKWHIEAGVPPKKFLWPQIITKKFTMSMSHNWHGSQL